ncbi:hypothetical protein AB6C82_23020, partial [Vibrio splendidus]
SCPSGETLVDEFELERVGIEFCCAMRISFLFEYHFSEPLGCPLSQHRSALQGRTAAKPPLKNRLWGETVNSLRTQK